MRNKHFNKKLALNKQTIASLNQEELSRLHGGAISGAAKCYTSPTYCTECYTDDIAWCEDISARSCIFCETL